MLSRGLWQKVINRYKRNMLEMDGNSSLSSDLKRCFFIGLGIGAGILASSYLIKKLKEQDNGRQLVVALNQMTYEIKELRMSLVHHFQRTASAFSNEQVLTSRKRRYKPKDVSQQEQVRKNVAVLEDESSSDDDFFDLPDEEIDIEQSNKNERYMFISQL